MNWAANRATKGLGASFKGVSAYLLSAKEGQTINDRLDFAQCRNLPTDNPAQAWRFMAETALRRDQLKLLAGGSNAGRKVKEGAFKPVFHYSLAWHPDQKPDQAEMERAALNSLKALKLDHHEILLVAHKDEEQAHLHVVVNRVDPETGKLNSLSNAFRKLDRWAAEYERETGEIVSPNREAKHRAIDEARDRPERQRWMPHEEWTQARHAARAANANTNERDTLWNSQQDSRAALLDAGKLRARELAQELREQQRPGWQELGRAHARTQRELDHALENKAGMVDFINRHRELLHKAWTDDETRRAEWHTLLTRGGLDRAVMRAHEMETAAFRRDVTFDRHQMHRAFWADYRVQVDQLRQAQTAERVQQRDQQRAQAPERTTHSTAKAELPKVDMPADRNPDLTKARTRKPRVQMPPAPTRPKEVAGGDPVTESLRSEPEAAKAARRALERMAAARQERLAAEAKARARRNLQRDSGLGKSLDRGGRDQ